MALAAANVQKSIIIFLIIRLLLVMLRLFRIQRIWLRPIADGSIR